jgi:hypothetical protein
MNAPCKRRHHQQREFLRAEEGRVQGEVGGHTLAQGLHPGAEGRAPAQSATTNNDERWLDELLTTRWNHRVPIILITRSSTTTSFILTHYYFTLCMFIALVIYLFLILFD